MERITHNGQQIWPSTRRASRTSKGRFTSLKAKLVAFGKWLAVRTALTAAFMAGITGVYYYGMSQATTVSATNKIVVAAAAPAEPSFPVLHKIALAESYDSQFCTKAVVAKKGCHSYEVGAPMIHVNANGTYDIGKYAINSTHLADAMAMGYDVYTEAGNEAFAKYLFETQGSVPWSASEYIWNR